MSPILRNLRSPNAVLLAVTIGLAGFGGWHYVDSRDRAEPSEAGAVHAGGSRAIEKGVHRASAGQRAAPSVASLLADLGEVNERFRDGVAGGESAKSLLERMRAMLKRAPRDVAAGAIERFFESGEDAATGLGLSFAGGGTLEEAPAMRVALLDLIGQIDPAVALKIGEVVFSEGRSAEEWALAMRNVAWTNLGGNFSGELGARFAEMLDRDDWLNAPSAGFLEAFDIAVHLGDFRQMADLSSVMNLEGGSKAVDWAAFLALDRMALRNPGMVFRYFEEDASLLAWAPVKRAALMARADVTVPAQREAVENYLLRGDLSAEEVTYFLNVFPNANFTSGERLVTTNEEVPSISGMLERDRYAAVVVDQWLGDFRFRGIRGDLLGLRERLGGYLAQTATY